MEKYTKNNSAEQEKASTTNLRIFGLGLVAVIVAAAAGIAVYKAMH